MTRLSKIPLLFIVCLQLLGTTNATAADPLRVMSFNIRYGRANDGDNHWDKRKELVVKTIKDFSPDLLGTQETLKFQADYLSDELGDYTYFGRSRMKTPNEHCGIFYRTERFTWLAGGHFWLSETPEVPESKSWDTSLPRMASWILLRNKQSTDNGTILLVNTHFDHRGSNARTESAKLIRVRIEELTKIAQSVEVVVTGDFNTAENSPPYVALLESNDGLRDTYRTAHPDRDQQEGTFNGWRGANAGPRIDWILASPSLSVQDASIVRISEDGRFPSDHYPVTAVFRR